MGTYGGGAEYVVADPSRLIPLPADGAASDWIMCQPVGTVLYSCQRMGSVLGKRVVILGQGAIGLSFTHLLSRMGAAEVIAADLLDYRLEKSLQRGATRTVNPLREDLVAAVAELTGGKGADVVIEAGGTPETVNRTMDLVRLYGTVVFFGLPEDDVFPFEFIKMARKQPVVIPTVSGSSDDPPGPSRTRSPWWVRAGSTSLGSSRTASPSRMHRGPTRCMRTTRTISSRWSWSCPAEGVERRSVAAWQPPSSGPDGAPRGALLRRERL